jgi:ribose/xylose/arabinose/galactoside ABC-type transport system permease subunit
MRGLVGGAFAASVAYMTLQAQGLYTQFTLISQDGTAHWAMLQLPAIWIALPALLVGLLVGAVAGWIKTMLGPNKSVDHYVSPGAETW